MPPEEGRRGDEEGDPAVTRDDPTRRREEDPVDGPEREWARRPLQHPELMAENEDLEVLGSVGSTRLSSADEETDEGADDEVEEEQHRPIVSGTVRRALRSWLAGRGRLDPALPMFVGRGGVAIPRRTVQQLVRRLAADAEIGDRCSPHVLRHTFARAFLANGGDVFSLQRILGHSPASLQVTRRYVRLIDDDLRASHRRASPIDRL